MNIVTPYAKLMDIPDQEAGDRLLRKIEWAARISHRSEDAQTQDSWRRFIKAVVLDHGDWSVVEHASATVDMLVDRGITHEVVRHRLFSFTLEAEPVILFRGRDKLALPMLNYYRGLCVADGCTDCQMQSMDDMIRRFQEFSDQSATMKQPGCTLGK